MTWRTLFITQPAKINLAHQSIQIYQNNETLQIPLEDTALIVIDNPIVVITSQLLSACAEAKIVLITVNYQHCPNGLFLPYLPHSRSLKILKSQINLKVTVKKQLWKVIICQKVMNQGQLLKQLGYDKQAETITRLAQSIQSGDKANIEAQASRLYFLCLFGKNFSRNQENFYNAALNYTYAIVRAMIARLLVCYGFNTALGIHHCNEYNEFNLADDVFEPYRSLIDYHVMTYLQSQSHYSIESPLHETLTTDHKKKLLSFTTQSILTQQSNQEPQKVSLSYAITKLVIGIQNVFLNPKQTICLPLPILG